MLIRSAKESDMKSIQNLWIDCFNDSQEYVNFYIEKRFDPDFCAILEMNREVVGMIHLLPCFLYPHQKALYWYAAGIHSYYRNQGLFRKFAQAVKAETNRLGYNNVCVPAVGLEKFYQSIGFCSEYKADDEIFERSVKFETDCQINFEYAHPRDFSEKLKCGFGDTLWDEKAVRYAMEENEYCGGAAFRFIYDDKQIRFFAIKKDKDFLIDYHNMKYQEFLKVKDAIIRKLECKRIIFRTKGNAKVVGLSDSKSANEHAKITMTLA